MKFLAASFLLCFFPVGFEVDVDDGHCHVRRECVNVLLTATMVQNEFGKDESFYMFAMFTSSTFSL